MTTKSTGSKELEAIETIILLLERVKSNEGILKVTEAIESKSKVIIKNELKKARSKVAELETSLALFEKGSDDYREEEEKQAKPTKKELPEKEEKPQENRPVFTVSSLEKIVQKKFVNGRAPGFEFTLDQVRDHIIKTLKLTERDRTYNTPNGSNLFSSSVRNTLRSMTNRLQLHRIKPGLYAVPLRGVNEQKEVNEFVSWES